MLFRSRAVLVGVQRGLDGGEQLTEAGLVGDRRCREGEPGAAAERVGGAVRGGGLGARRKREDDEEGRAQHPETVALGTVRPPARGYSGQATVGASPAITAQKKGSMTSRAWTDSWR